MLVLLFLVPGTPSAAVTEAAPPARASTAGAPTGECAQLPARLRSLGKGAVGLCEQQVPVGPVLGSPTTGPAPAAAPIYVPAECYSRIGADTVPSRFEWCSIIQSVVTLTRWNENGSTTVIGSFTYRRYSYAATTAYSNAWFHQIGFELLGSSGTISGIKYSDTDGGCAWGTCSRDSINFPGRHILSGSPLMGTANVRMNLSPGASAAAQTFMRFRWTHDDPRVLPSGFITDTSFQIRCDNASPGLSGFGCVQQYYFVPSFELFMTDPAVELAAHHIYQAQASGLPGADPKTSLPNKTPLHRLVNDYLVQQNTNRACPATYVRPDGYQCDEYPFKSTQEGAATANPGGPARTNPSWCHIPEPSGSGPFGYSVCMIPGLQNTTAGGRLGNFYLANRIMHADAFYIWIRCC